MCSCRSGLLWAHINCGRMWGLTGLATAPFCVLLGSVSAMRVVWFEVILAGALFVTSLAEVTCGATGSLLGLESCHEWAKGAMISAHCLVFTAFLFPATLLWTSYFGGVVSRVFVCLVVLAASCDGRNGPSHFLLVAGFLLCVVLNGIAVVARRRRHDNVTAAAAVAAVSSIVASVVSGTMAHQSVDSINKPVAWAVMVLASFVVVGAALNIHANVVRPGRW